VQPAALDPVTRDWFPFDRDPNIPKTVGNYWPYATTLYDHVSHAMPYTAPGSLTADEAYALTAYLLAENGVVARDAVMDARTRPRVTLPARRRLVPDDHRGGPGSADAAVPEHV
jgi:S-disulfanyl-L-cysteine oxidoreductase SoxD